MSIVEIRCAQPPHYEKVYWGRQLIQPTLSYAISPGCVLHIPGSPPTPSVSRNSRAPPPQHIHRWSANPPLGLAKQGDDQAQINKNESSLPTFPISIKCGDRKQTAWAQSGVSPGSIRESPSLKTQSDYSKALNVSLSPLTEKWGCGTQDKKWI